LQFIAQFFGACIVESGGAVSEAQFEVEAKLAGRCAHRRCPDHDHKMILLREYLSRAAAIRVRSHVHTARG
jgi:hypothetical protein